MAPVTVDSAYPKGADYFELEGIMLGPVPRIRFYYAPDVDTVDFSKFRTAPFLRQIEVDARPESGGQVPPKN